jgi:hypothetical protein
VGVSEYTALLTATVLSGGKVSYDAVKARRLDPFAGYLIGKPLTKVIAERVRPDGDEDEPGETEFKRRLHILLSAMWGIGLLIGMVLQLIVIFTLPVDVVNAVGTAMSLVLTALFIVATVVVARRARARWEQRSPSQG